jgi:ankyrin repeat protein
MPDFKKEFIKAAKSGDIEKIKFLFGADAELIHARDKDGSTALHCAVWKGHEE